MKLALDHPELVIGWWCTTARGSTSRLRLGRSCFALGCGWVRRLMTILSPHPREVPAFVTKAVLRKFAQTGGYQPQYDCDDERARSAGLSAVQDPAADVDRVGRAGRSDSAVFWKEDA